MGYIKKHWNGDLPLSISFWVNLFLLNMLLTVITILINETVIFEYPPANAKFLLVYNFTVLIIIYIWQISGTWNSAVKHIEKGNKFFWARVAQVVIVLGVLATIGNVQKQSGEYSEIYKVAFPNDEYQSYEVSLLPERNILQINGGLGFGVSNKFEEMLEDNKGITAVILNSPGGRIYEGRKLSEAIIKYKLDTFSTTGCYSACVTAFISGKNRYLSNDANLGFHKYKAAYDGTDADNEIALQQEKDIVTYKRHGVSDEFIKKMFNADNNDLWYPTFDELVSANVIHGTIDKSEIKPIKYNEDVSKSKLISSLETELSSNKLYQVIKKHDPKLHDSLIEDAATLALKGADASEIAYKLSSRFETIATSNLKYASNNSIISFANSTTKVMKKLHDIDPILCIKMMFPDKYGSVPIQKYISIESLTILNNSIAFALTDAYELEAHPDIDKNSAERLLESVASDLGAKVTYLDVEGLKNKSDYSQACNAYISFYQSILSRNKGEAGNTLRYVFSDI